MTIQFGKNNVQVHRNSWRDTAINRNIGLGEVNRNERATLKLAFVELRLRYFVLAFYRQLAPIEPISVGERGAW